MAFMADLAIAAAPTVIGGLFGDKGPSAQEQAVTSLVSNAMATRQHPTHIRKGAERAGFNPLTYLQANGAPAAVDTRASGAPPLASPAALAGIVENFIERREIRAAQAEEVEQDAQEQIDKKTREQARETASGPTIGRTMASVKSVQPGSAVTALRQNAPFFPIAPATIEVGRVKKRMPADVVTEHLGPIRASRTAPDGRILEFPMLEDPESIAAGVLAEHYMDDDAGRYDDWKNAGKGVFGYGAGLFSEYQKQGFREGWGGGFLLPQLGAEALRRGVSSKHRKLELPEFHPGNQ